MLKTLIAIGVVLVGVFTSNGLAIVLGLLALLAIWYARQETV